MRRYNCVPIFLALLFGVVLLFGQPLQDPWHRPLNPQGGSAGITYGTTAPSLASTGMNPGQGELWLDPDGATDTGPILNVWDHVTGVWDAQLSSAALTAGTIPVFNGIELIDSTVDDDLVDVVATGGLLTIGTAVDAADSILIDGNNDTFQFEGGTANAAEILFTAVDPFTDLTIFLDNPAAGTSGSWMELDGAIAARDAGVIWRGIYLDIDSPADHLGAATLRAIELNNDLNTASAIELGVYFNQNFDVDVSYADAGSINIGPAGQAVDFIFGDVPAAGAGGDIFELDATLTIMDAIGGDVTSVFLIDIENAVHTGGTLYGFEIEGITQAAGAEETAEFIGAGWDIDIHFGDDTALINWFETGGLSFEDYSGDINLILEDMVDYGAVDATVAAMELQVAMDIMDAGDLQYGIHLDINNANHTGGSVYGINMDLSAEDPNADEFGILFDDNWDEMLRFTTAGIIAYNNNGVLTFQDTGAAAMFMLRDVPAAGTANDLMELDVTPTAMNDAGDTFRAFYIDINGAADHTNGTVVAIDLDNATDDVQSTDVGIRFDADFDRQLSFVGNAVVSYTQGGGTLTLQDHTDATHFILTSTPAAGTAVASAEIDFTPGAMDGAADIFRGLLIDINGAEDHTNGYIRGADFDLATDDAQSMEGGAWFNATWDAAFVIEHQAGAPAENPPAGWVMFTVDDNADYSAGGGNDCALVSRTSAGNTMLIGIVVLNGVCP